MFNFDDCRYCGVRDSEYESKSVVMVKMRYRWCETEVGRRGRTTATELKGTRNLPQHGGTWSDLVCTDTLFPSEMDHGLPHDGEYSKQSDADHPPYLGTHGQTADAGGCVLLSSQP